MVGNLNRKNCNDRFSIVRYKIFSFTDNRSDFEADCSNQQNQSSTQHSSAIEYVKLARKFKTNYSTINAVHAINRGSIILVGENRDGVKWLILMDQTGRILWSRELDIEPSGVASISLACTPCFVLAYNEGSKIDFHDMKKKDTILLTLDLKGHNPGCLGTKGHILSYVDWSTTPRSLKFVDCSCFPPEVQESESLTLSNDLVVDVCLVQTNNSLRAVISTDKALSAYDVNGGTPLWQISSKIGSGKESLYPWGICTNDKGHLFVADRANDCIHLIGVDGTFMKTIPDELPYVQEIIWDLDHGRLIVQYEEDDPASDSDEYNQCSISTFQVKYKASNSGLGKFVGSLFGNTVGDWVEGNIDTVKYAFSDIGKV